MPTRERRLISKALKVCIQRGHKMTKFDPDWGYSSKRCSHSSRAECKICGMTVLVVTDPRAFMPNPPDRGHILGKALNKSCAVRKKR